MDPYLFSGFVLASAVLVLIPGPVVTLVVANSLAHGPRYGLLTVAGTSLATLMLLVVWTLGMSSILIFLLPWFEWLRWAGAAYLVFLGIQQWRARTLALEDQAADDAPPRAVFWHGFLVSATNPKAIFFYAAFFPQFMDPALPPTTQLTILSATFLVVATSLNSSYALLAGRLRRLLRGARRARLRNRLSGSLLIGAGVGLALARRS